MYLPEGLENTPFNKTKENATRIQNILTHSVWASVWLFLTFATMKVVGEP